MQCKECKGECDPHYPKAYTKQLCFSCDYWLRLVNHPHAVRVMGVHFVDGGYLPDAPRSCLGFGGKLHVVEFKDGRRVTTNNLWHQGVIPKRFRDRMPDNAMFV